MKVDSKSLIAGSVAITLVAAHGPGDDSNLPGDTGGPAKVILSATSSGSTSVQDGISGIEIPILKPPRRWKAVDLDLERST